MKLLICCYCQLCRVGPTDDIHKKLQRVTLVDIRSALKRLEMDWNAPSGRKWKVLLTNNPNQGHDNIDLTLLPEFKDLKTLLENKVPNLYHGAARAHVELSEEEWISCRLSNVCIRVGSFITVTLKNSHGKDLCTKIFTPLWEKSSGNAVAAPKADSLVNNVSQNNPTHDNSSRMSSIRNLGPSSFNLQRGIPPTPPNSDKVGQKRRGVSSNSFLTAFQEYKAVAEQKFTLLSQSDGSTSPLFELVDIVHLSNATKAPECQKSITIGKVVEMVEHTSKKDPLYQFVRLKLTNTHGSFLDVFLHGPARDYMRTQTISGMSVQIVALRNLKLVPTRNAKSLSARYSLNNAQDITVVSTGKDAAHPKFPEGSSCRVQTRRINNQEISNGKTSCLTTSGTLHMGSQIHISRSDGSLNDFEEDPVSFDSDDDHSDPVSHLATLATLSLAESSETTALLHSQRQIFGLPKAMCLFGKECDGHIDHVRSEWVIFENETNTHIKVNGKRSKDKIGNLDLYRPILISFHKINYKDLNSQDSKCAGFACCNICHQEHERDKIWQRASISLDYSNLPSQPTECVHIRTVRTSYQHNSASGLKTLSEVYIEVASNAKPFKNVEAKRTHLWSCLTNDESMDDVEMSGAPKREIIQLCLDQNIPDGQRFRVLQIGYPGTDYFALVLNGRMATAQQAHCIVCDSNNCPHAQYVRRAGGLKQVMARPSSDDFMEVMNKHCDPNHGNSLRIYGSSKLRIPEMIPAAVRLKERMSTKLRIKQQSKIAGAVEQTRDREERTNWLSGYGSGDDSSDTCSVTDSIIGFGDIDSDPSADCDACDGHDINFSASKTNASALPSSESQDGPRSNASPQYLRFKQEWHKMPDGSCRILGSTLYAENSTPCSEGSSSKVVSNTQQTARVPMAKLYKVFHIGSVFLLPVQGDIAAYDGKSDDLIHARGDIFFTYEFLAVFIQMLLVSSTTFHAYLRTALSSNISCFEGETNLTEEDNELLSYMTKALESIEHRSSDPPVLVHFRESVFDFITLQVSQSIGVSIPLSRMIVQSCAFWQNDDCF